MNHGYGYRSDQRRRKENQDRHGVFVFDDVVLLVVCDGMGGHAGGAQASALAVRSLYDAIANPADADLRTSLRRAVESANRAIYEASRKNYKLSGMGTTCVAVLIEDGVAHVAHVGDSRVLLVRNGELKQLTRDHTMVNLFVDAELLSPEDAATHPEAHVLSRSLGVERHVEVEMAPPLNLQSGDRILLTSDGVHGVVPASSLVAFDWTHPVDAVDKVLAAVEAANGDDNATLVAWAWGYQGRSMPATPPPDPAASSDPGGLGHEPIVSSLGGGHHAESGPLDDVAPIEDFDDLAESFAPTAQNSPAPTAVKTHEVRRSSNRRAFVAIGGLAVIGTVLALALFSSNPRSTERVVFRGAPADAPVINATAVAPGVDPSAAPGANLGAAPGADPIAAPGANPAAAPGANGDAAPGANADATASAAAPGSATPAPKWTGYLTDAPLLDPEVPLDELPDDASLLCVDVVACQLAAPTASAWQTAARTGDWAPPPRCIDCTRSLSRPSSLAYLMPDGRERITGVFFQPTVPQSPTRNPAGPTRYADNAPRGPAQATTIRYARAGDCKTAMTTVDAAMERSIDNAVLYRTVWFCFNETHQGKIAEATAATFEDFVKLLPHFQGELAPSAPSTWTWSAPATDGVEYRLQRFETGLELRGFQDVMHDMLGDATLADQLGTDLLLEATAAAAASRSDAVTDKLVDVWARRVFITTKSMNSSVGDLVRQYRPDLADLIDGLLFEATGGDAGASALERGEPNTFVPAEVAKAHAMALGMEAAQVTVHAPGTVGAAAQAVASASAARRPPVRTAAAPKPAAPKPAQPPPPPPPTNDDAMQIRVYRSAKE